MPSANSYTVEHDLIDACRSCGSEQLEPIIEFGPTPLADRLLDEQTRIMAEPVCPLSVVFCHECSLLQIVETVRPEVLFHSDYPYFSSVSPALLRHFEGNVKETRVRRPVGANGLVVEVASNDGYLLRNYARDGIPVLGIDPTQGPAQAARALGIETIQDFFSAGLAEDLRNQGKMADVIHANNVLAHVADTNGFVAGLSTILREDGLLVVECPYVVDLVDNCEFDTIYHQHLCYFSLHALKRLFGQHGLYVQDLQRLTIHGGSLRLFVGKKDTSSDAVTYLLKDELKRGVTTNSFYADFRRRIEHCRLALVTELEKLKSSGNRIVGYGAPAKACTLMTFMGLGPNYLEYLVDKSEVKQGRFYPGNHLAIRKPEVLVEDEPDYALLLAWNFAEEIMADQAEYSRRGGKFIIPIPQVTVK